MTNRDICSKVRVILIGGSSHVGKSTLAESLAARLSWTRISTDTLARHPGRPWRQPPEEVPDDVSKHYLSRSADQLFEDVLHHYRINVWPKVESIVGSHSHEASAPQIILEGSALWPGFAASLEFNRVAALWLTASEDIFRQRIYEESRYHSKSPRERAMVDKFLERTLIYNAKMVEVANRHDYVLVDVLQSDVAGLTDRCLARLSVDQQ